MGYIGGVITRQVFWTKAILDAFVIEGNLNRRQEYIIRTRAEGYTIAYQADKLHLSIDQINKEISKIKKIYDVAQKTSKILPERKKNLRQLYKEL